MERSVTQQRGWNKSYIQREDFKIRVQHIIEEYGGGGTALKELVGNSDDAKAAEFVVFIDGSQYSRPEPPWQNMVAWQGPALVVWNSARFSRQDWINLTAKVGNSSKAGHTHTIGKFGLGALTAYIFTDVPQVLSDDRLLLLDPHALYLPEQHLSMLCNFVDQLDSDHVNLADDAASVIEPFVSFNASCPVVPDWEAEAPYPGTVFRFPLRVPETALASTISKISISKEDCINTIVNPFLHTTAELVLFTRHTKSISAYVKESQGADSILLQQCVASSAAAPVLASANSSFSYCTVTVSNKTGTDHSSRQTWLRVDNPAAMSCGVAILIHDSAAAAGRQYLPSIAGKVFITLPLPLENTGLPVHINGAFKVQSDRRNLWSGQDDGGKGAQNIAILEDEIAPTWAAAVAAMTGHPDCVGLEQLIYVLWPTAVNLSPAQLQPVAASIVRCFIDNGYAVFWIPSVTSAAYSGGEWVNATQACFLSADDKAATPLVADVARRAALKIPDLPKHALEATMEAVKAGDTQIHMLSPAVLRESLRKAGKVVKPSEVAAILGYVISDEHFEDLHGLYLAHLRSGDVTRLSWQGKQEGQMGAEKLFIACNKPSSDVLELMSFNKAVLLEPSVAWEKLARAKASSGALILESGLLNAQAPSVADMAATLPAAWQGGICYHLHQISGKQHPPMTWVQRFWDLVQSVWKTVPEELFETMLVPVSNKRLASPAFCQAHAALSTVHQQRWSRDVLDRLVLLCITSAQADMLSPISPDKEPFTCALEAAARLQQVPLQQLVCPEQMGQPAFSDLRRSLATNLPAPPNPPEPGNAIWRVLSRCCVFEASDGSTTHLSFPVLSKLPNASWEQQLPNMRHLLWFTPVRFHSASPTHQSLVNHACLPTPDLSDFLNAELLPSLQAEEEYNSNHEALLLHALDDLANDPDFAPTMPTCLPTHGVLQDVSRLVDSSSWLLRTLFSSRHPHPDYQLLPAQYATTQRLSVLKKVQLAHEESPNPSFFLACASQFAKVMDALNRDDQLRCSLALVKLLQEQADAYCQHAGSAWSTVRYTLAGLRIFPTAELPPPYNVYAWHWRPFCSLLESEDHEYYRLVSTALPVMSNSVLGTEHLRSKLGLPTHPSVLRVIDHLINMAGSEAAGCLRQTGAATQALRQQLLADFRAGYHIIVSAASLRLIQPADLTTLNNMSQRLASSQWLLVSGGFFVSPQSVYFGLQQDTGGAFTVPAMVLQALQDHPSVKQWLVSVVGMHDLSDGDPAVLHSMDDTIKMALFSQHVGPDFNNQDAYTDAQVMSSDGVLIHVHKHIVAKACPYLAIASSPTWNAGNEPVKLDASHATATLFLKYFYTGELCWPEGPDAPSRHQCALELLQLADKYNVPVLLCAAEVVLSQAVDENTCCELLDIADTYHAEQLKGLCLHRVKKAYGIVRDTEEFRALSAPLRQLVEQDI